MDKTKARARALSNAVATVLDEADTKYRSRRSSDFFAAPSSSSSSSLGGEAIASDWRPPPPPPGGHGGKPEASESSWLTTHDPELASFLLWVQRWMDRLLIWTFA